MTKYNYKILVVSIKENTDSIWTDKVVEALNNEGIAGWKLIGKPDVTVYITDRKYIKLLLIRER